MKNEISDSDEGGETRVGSARPLLEYRPLRRTVSPLFYVISHMRGLRLTLFQDLGIMPRTRVCILREGEAGDADLG